MNQIEAFNIEFKLLLDKYGLNIYAKDSTVITEIAVPMKLRKNIVFENGRRVAKDVWSPVSLGNK